MFPDALLLLPDYPLTDPPLALPDRDFPQGVSPDDLFIPPSLGSSRHALRLTNQKPQTELLPAISCTQFNCTLFTLCVETSFLRTTGLL